MGVYHLLQGTAAGPDASCNLFCAQHGGGLLKLGIDWPISGLELWCALQWTVLPAPAVQRDVSNLVALGGDLYVYGGARQMHDGEDTILADILVARTQNGIVNQPWKRFSVSKPPPSAQIKPCRLSINSWTVHLQGMAPYVSPHDQ